MRAITEIPANTPRPMGSTCSFFPGIVKGVALADEFSAAADTVEADVLLAESAALVIVDEVDTADVVVPAEDVTEVLDELPADDVADADADTEVTGLTEMAPLLVAVDEDADADVDTVNVDPLDDAGVVEAALEVVVVEVDEDESVVEEDKEVVEVETESVEEELLEAAVEVDPELLLPFDTVTVHCFTSTTLPSVVGVNVIVHVSVITP